MTPLDGNHIQYGSPLQDSRQRPPRQGNAPLAAGPPPRFAAGEVGQTAAEAAGKPPHLEVAHSALPMRKGGAAGTKSCCSMSPISPDTSSGGARRPPPPLPASSTSCSLTVPTAYSTASRSFHQSGRPAALAAAASCEKRRAGVVCVCVCVWDAVEEELLHQAHACASPEAA
jgi:hypothetical protein